jgi:hypothetical protein
LTFLPIAQSNPGISIQLTAARNARGRGFSRYNAPFRRPAAMDAAAIVHQPHAKSSGLVRLALFLASPHGQAGSQISSMHVRPKQHCEELLQSAPFTMQQTLASPVAPTPQKLPMPQQSMSSSQATPFGVQQIRISEPWPSNAHTWPSRQHDSSVVHLSPEGTHATHVNSSHLVPWQQSQSRLQSAPSVWQQAEVFPQAFVPQALVLPQQSHASSHPACRSGSPQQTAWRSLPQKLSPQV